VCLVVDAAAHMTRADGYRVRQGQGCGGPLHVYILLTHVLVLLIEHNLCGRQGPRLASGLLCVVQLPFAPTGPTILSSSFFSSIGRHPVQL